MAEWIVRTTPTPPNSFPGESGVIGAVWVPIRLLDGRTVGICNASEVREESRHSFLGRRVNNPPGPPSEGRVIGLQGAKDGRARQYDGKRLVFGSVAPRDMAWWNIPCQTTQRLKELKTLMGIGVPSQLELAYTWHAADSHGANVADSLKFFSVLEARGPKAPQLIPGSRN
eukprot:767074-Hanusia_phi.AAC.4